MGAFQENSAIRHLGFDLRTNMYADVLWVKQGGMLGRHRHRGHVFGYTVEGSWRFLEYDWIARAGSYIQESPGAIHMLVSDEGMKAIFWLNGALEFFDENNHLLEPSMCFGSSIVIEPLPGIKGSRSTKSCSFDLVRKVLRDDSGRCG